MATQRFMRSVLPNFLGTYLSRNTDYQGYWLFGFLVENLIEIEFDLLALVSEESASPLHTAARLAVSKFADQVSKAGLSCRQVYTARLTICR